MKEPKLDLAEQDVVDSPAQSIIGPDGAPLRRVKLLPYGTFSGRDGRGPWVLDGKDHADQVIATTRAVQGNTDMVFDYDHQTALAAVPGVGGRAPAAGWISVASLAAEGDGIYGDVSWTDAADAALRAKVYRYYSPHFRALPGTGRITRLVNAGLTNTPNLDLPALASARHGSIAAQVTEEERAICAMTGIAEADFLAQKARDVAALAAAGAGASPDLALGYVTEDERRIIEALGISEASYLKTKASGNGVGRMND